MTRGEQNVRNGNYSVVAANHTLILNWNAQTVPLLRQIAINRRERADDTYKGCVCACATSDRTLGRRSCCLRKHHQDSSQQQNSILH